MEGSITRFSLIFAEFSYYAFKEELCWQDFFFDVLTVLERKLFLTGVLDPEK